MTSVRTVIHRLALVSMLGFAGGAHALPIELLMRPASGGRRQAARNPRVCVASAKEHGA
jgi:hypothetical protein